MRLYFELTPFLEKLRLHRQQQNENFNLVEPEAVVRLSGQSREI